MTLSFSSFSIRDILTGRDARGEPGTTRELCAPKRNMCTGHGAARVPDPSHRDSDEDRVHPERLPADLSESGGNLRSDAYSEESTGEETELREGEHFVFGNKVKDNKSFHLFTELLQLCIYQLSVHNWHIEIRHEKQAKCCF